MFTNFAFNTNAASAPTAPAPTEPDPATAAATAAIAAANAAAAAAANITPPDLLRQAADPGTDDEFEANANTGTAKPTPGTTNLNVQPDDENQPSLDQHTTPQLPPPVPALQPQPTLQPTIGLTAQNGTLAKWAAFADPHGPPITPEATALDMLRFVHLVRQTGGDILKHLEAGYDAAPPDPGFLLVLCDGRLTLLHGTQRCHQPTSTWNNAVVSFVGDTPQGATHPAFCVWSGPLKFNQTAREVTLNHLASASSAKAQLNTGATPTTIAPKGRTTKQSA